MTSLPSHAIRALPRERSLVVDVLASAARRHTVHALLEVDVTRARREMRARVDEGGEPVSFTAWIVACVARTARGHEELRSIRVARRVVVCPAADVSVVVERRVGARLVPLPVVVRAAETKSLGELQAEIRAAQSGLRDARELARFGVFAKLPSWLRRALLWWSERSVGLSLEYKPPIAVTSVGPVAGKGALFAVPLAPVTLSVTIGGLVDRPALRDGVLESREHVCLTLSLDHDVVDGAPAARFCAHLRERMEAGLGDA